MASQLRIQLGIAALYGVTGWLSLQVLASTGYVAAVYPPAGIALGAAILLGYRIWPAVAVGALITNVLATFYAGGSPGPAVLVSVAGATMQALAGAWLARRLIELPNPLDTPRSIGRLLFVVAPLSSLINASVSIPTLYLTGLVEPQDMLSSWGGWWLGDTLGALVALPLMFVFLGRPASMWRGRRLTVAAPC